MRFSYGESDIFPLSKSPVLVMWATFNNAFIKT